MAPQRGDTRGQAWSEAPGSVARSRWHKGRPWDDARAEPAIKPDVARGVNSVLQDVLKRTPQYEAAYVTLAKIHFSAGRSKEGIAVLEQLLQRNPAHAVAQALLRQWKAP